MTRVQENNLSMWTTVDAILKKYEAIWQALGGFDAAVQKFRKIKNEMNPQAGLQTSSITGIAEDKMAVKKKLAALTLQMGLNIKSYAMATENIILQEQFSFTPTFFVVMRDNTLPVVVNGVLTQSRQLASELEAYGSTTENINLLQETLEAYGKTNPAPRIAIVERKIATAGVAAKFAEGTKQLKIMDHLVGNFKKESPDFITEFKGARIVIPNGTRHKIKIEKEEVVVSEW